ncbi:hypothetical protein AB6A40_001316 [Gnathostoma spinigerum]|uniref:BED-type domain-containing protein n=1 Tax=Gnathostoma spinigerum TaxID=75299 RepID=A0ABD6E604_9BILA
MMSMISKKSPGENVPVMQEVIKCDTVDEKIESDCAHIVLQKHEENTQTPMKKDKMDLITALGLDRENPVVSTESNGSEILGKDSTEDHLNDVKAMDGVDDCNNFEPNRNEEVLPSVPNKKKRQRRNPVWPYFEVGEGVASCKQCSYSTKSVFSTNLKVHLRTHHNDTYKKVIAEEEQQHAALQKSLMSQSPVTPLVLPSFIQKFSTTNANSENDAALLSSILCRINNVAQNWNSLCTPTRSNTNGSASPVAGISDSPSPKTPTDSDGITSTDVDNLFNKATTSATPDPSSLTSLLGIGKIDELNLPVLNQAPSCSSKRKRLRRHPVWRFFKDVDGTKSVGCIKCTFNTSSPFSTNLKMHLKAHHRQDYSLVLHLEQRQREEEGIRNEWASATTSNGNNASGMSLFDDEDRMQSMSTADRLAFMVEAATNNLEHTDNSDSSITAECAKPAVSNVHPPSTSTVGGSECLSNGSTSSSTTTRSSDDPTSSISNSDEIIARFGLTGSDLLRSSPLLQKNSLVGTAMERVNNNCVSRSETHSNGTVQHRTSNGAHPSSSSTEIATKSVRTISKKLPTGEVVKVRMMRKDVGNDAPPEVKQPKLNEENNDVTRLLFANRSIDSSLNSVNTLKNAMRTILDKSSDPRVARDESLARFLNKSKAFHLLGMPEFKHFVQTLAPDYQLPSSGSLKRLAETLNGIP